MSNIFLRQAFSPSCPSGGTWYACTSSSSFVGCCNTDPCQLGCSDGSLQPASFDPAFYGQFPDQQCSTGSRWYTCAKTSPPFLGCCKSNACKAGACPVGDLTAAFLSSNAALAAPFLNGSTSSTSAAAVSSSSSSSSTTDVPSTSSFSTSSSLSSTTQAGPSSAPTTVYIYSVISSPSISSSTTGPTPTEVAAQSKSSHVPTPRPMPTGAIAGGAVGGVAVVAFILGIFFFCFRRRAARRGMVDETQPPISKDSPYADSSPITPIPAYKPFTFPSHDEKCIPSASYTPTEPMALTPPLHPAIGIPSLTHPPPTGRLSRSIGSELAAEQHGIYHTAELDGRAIGGPHPRGSSSFRASTGAERSRRSNGRSYRIDTGFVAYKPQMPPPYGQQRRVMKDKGGFI